MAEAVVDEVIALLRARPALRWLHVPDSRQLPGNPGFPDFIVVGPGGVIFREAKPHPGARLRPGQTGWSYALMAAGADFALWYPEDLANGSVGRELDQLANPAASP